jgi:2-polyprenyl-6-methoxyphenol hydroxylase-like FAD-dependent oxidoreductase
MSSAAFLDALVERDLIGADLRRFDAGAMRWVGRDAGSSSGRLLGSDPPRSPMGTLTWGDLYTQLRRRVPPGVSASGSTVVEVEVAEPRPRLRLTDGSRREYDVVVCADGYRSLGRSTLFPEAALQYRGYVLWRGLLPQRRAKGTDVLEVSGVRCGYAGGHGVFYLVPSSEPDRRDAELPALLTDRRGRRSNGSVSAGMIPPDREAALKARAGELLPEVFAQVVGSSRDTFVQAVYTVTVPAYHRGRVCLVGDAGTLYPPFTGSGVFKAIFNAIDLAHRLRIHRDVDQALAAWNDVQLRTGATRLLRRRIGTGPRRAGGGVPT